MGESTNRDRALSERDGAIKGIAPRFRQHLLRLARIPEASAAHPSQLRAAGRFWQGLRKDAGLSLQQVSDRVGVVTRRELSLFESGLLDPSDLPGDFVDRLANAVGRADAVAVHIAKFGLDSNDPAVDD